MNVSNLLSSKDLIHIINVGYEGKIFTVLDRKNEQTSLNQKYEKIITHLKIDFNQPKLFDLLAEKLQFLKNGFSDVNSSSLKTLIVDFMEDAKRDVPFLNAHEIYDLTFESDEKVSGFVYKHIQLLKKEIKN